VSCSEEPRSFTRQSRSLCCSNGSRVLPTVRPYPEPLAALIAEDARACAWHTRSSEVLPHRRPQHVRLAALVRPRPSASRSRSRPHLLAHLSRPPSAPCPHRQRAQLGEGPRRRPALVRRRSRPRRRLHRRRLRPSPRRPGPPDSRLERQFRCALVLVHQGVRC
jgi:hypothetical protein